MKPRLSRIILTDWPALFLLIGIPGIWLCGFAFPFVRRGAQFGAFEMLTVALPISVLAAALFLWRVFRIRYLFARGEPAPAYITRIRLARDRGRIDFLYEFAGQNYESWTPVHQNRAVLALREHQQVEILVDPAHPSRAIIHHLYT